MKNIKSLGQNWLKDRFILDDIASLAREDTTANLCLEIGPGLGTLTSALLRQFNRVLAVEFDERLAHNLPASFPGKNLEVINADFLKFDLSSIKEPYVVAANIPYYITSPIIDKLLTAGNHPEKIVLLIQKEVAERIAKYKCKHSPLSLKCQNLSDVTLGPVVDKTYFTPMPKVDSQIIILSPLEAPRVPLDTLSFASRAFKMPRKKLSANLSTSMGISREEAIRMLQEANLNIDYRPEDLSLEDWNILAKKFKMR